MHTAMLANAAVHDRGSRRGSGPLRSGGPLFSGREVQEAHLATHDTLPPISSASIADTAADHPRRRSDPISNQAARLLQRMSPAVDLRSG